MLKRNAVVFIVYLTVRYLITWRIFLNTSRIGKNCQRRKSVSLIIACLRFLFELLFLFFFHFFVSFFLNFAFLSPIWILIIFLVFISFLPKTMSSKLLLLILGFLIMCGVILLFVFIATDKNLYTRFLQKT